jgi:signal transduction histidine kinase
MKTKTMSGRTRHSQLGLYVGLSMTIAASLALEGVALWRALDRDSGVSAWLSTRMATGLTDWAIAGGSLICLAGAALICASVMRERTARGMPTEERAARRVATAQPATEEEAAAQAHAQKMEALGLLAGGVAHDFNNLLHVIRNALEILQRQGAPADTRRYLDMIRRSTDRAAALTRQLLAFSRRQPPDQRPLDANDLVIEVTELLRHSLGDRITIRTALGREVWRAAADAGQLETALLNLAINARDAMQQAGQLTIETANAVLEESGARAPSDEYVMIAVSDTGTGMPPEVAARACEPFFTTKGPGHGTGLGLSQVAGFARQCGGQVRISTEPGRGTTVRLYLPKAAGEIMPLKALVPPQSVPRTQPGTLSAAGCPKTRTSTRSFWNRELHRLC